MPYLKYEGKTVYSISSIIFNDYIKAEINIKYGKDDRCIDVKIEQKKTLDQISNDMSFPHSVYNNIINSVKNIKYKNQSYWDILNIKEFNIYEFNDSNSYFEFSNINLFSDDNSNFIIKPGSPENEKIKYCIDKMNILVNKTLYMERCRKLLYIANYDNRTNTTEEYGKDYIDGKKECYEKESYYDDCRYNELNHSCWIKYNKIPNDFELNSDKLNKYELNHDEDLQQ